MEGVWKVQLAWHSSNPPCSISLLEEVHGEERFQVKDNQKCKCSGYVYMHVCACMHEAYVVKLDMFIRVSYKCSDNCIPSVS